MSVTFQPNAAPQDQGTGCDAPHHNWKCHYHIGSAIYSLR